MPLSTGSTLASYEILGPLGAGAMGEVYRARDTRLDREVAIKVLPEAFSEDPERLRRFEREAKTLAALNHPNVAQIFGVDRAGAASFLVLELVPGETLEDRLKRGPLPIDETIDVAREIAAGLEAAHEAGVIHRDLKPANVRLTPDGHVKVLDFGLAKPMRAGTGAENDPRSTDSVLTTESGRLLGTPTYMAPEQARGRAIDRRVDVWAFGCVLFECLTATRVFDGESMTDVLAAVVSREPDLSRLPSGTPRPVRTLLDRCLVKDPRQRLRDIGDARLELERAAKGADDAPGAAPRWFRFAPWLVAAVLGALLVVTLTRTPADAPPSERKPVHVAVRLPSPVRLFLRETPDQNGILAISPDGSRLVFLGREGDVQRLYLRSLHSPFLDALAETEDAVCPFFSPDGTWVAFASRGKLRKVSVAGGQPIDICDIGTPRGAAWGPDGTIVFTPSTTSPLMRVHGDGGTPVPVTELDSTRDERSHRWPAFLPGGDEVAFTVGVVDKPGDYDDATIDAVSLSTGRRRTLVRGASLARALPPDRLLLGRDGQLFALSLDAADGSTLNASTPVFEGVAGIPGSGVLHFDVAKNGTLAFVELDAKATQFEFAWISRDGEEEPLPHPPREYRTPKISPDGSRIAVAIGPGGGRSSDIWILDAARAGMTRLTFDGVSKSPSWTSDGKRVLFSTIADIHQRFAWKLADGNDEGETVVDFTDSLPRFPAGFTPDGAMLPFVTSGLPGTAQDIYYWSKADGISRPLAQSPAGEQYAALSPDGKWIAFVSDESGRREVYVHAFPERRGRWQVTDAGGGFPVWSRDGSELYYVSGRTLFAVAVTAAESFAHGPPRVVLESDFLPGTESRVNYDVASDGRFLVLRGTSREAVDGHVECVLDWGASLLDARAR